MVAKSDYNDIGVDIVISVICRSRDMPETNTADKLETNANDAKPGLVVSFNGASAKTLHGLMDPDVGRDQQISIADAEWGR